MRAQLEQNNVKTLKDRLKKREKELLEVHQKTIGNITGDKKAVEEKLSECKVKLAA